jgi:hypothetical protein
MEKKTNHLIINKINVPLNYIIYYNMLNRNYQGKLNNIFCPLVKNINIFQDIKENLKKDLEKKDKNVNISENYEINDKYIDKSNLTIYKYKEIILNKVSYINDESDWVIVKNQDI